MEPGVEGADGGAPGGPELGGPRHTVARIIPVTTGYSSSSDGPSRWASAVIPVTMEYHHHDHPTTTTTAPPAPPAQHRPLVSDAARRMTPALRPYPPCSLHGPTATQRTRAGRRARRGAGCTRATTDGVFHHPASIAPASPHSRGPLPGAMPPPTNHQAPQPTWATPESRGRSGGATWQDGRRAGAATKQHDSILRHIPPSATPQLRLPRACNT